MKKQLIITADDFEYSRNRNCGIVEAFQAGAITRASLIVNAEGSQDAAGLAIQHSIPLGKNTQQPVIFPKNSSIQHSIPLGKNTQQPVIFPKNSSPKIELNFDKKKVW